MAEATEQYENPKEILEIEEAYGITLTQEESDPFLILYSNFTFSLDENRSINTLKIRSANIETIEPIIKCTELKNLDLSYNKIFEIEKIESLVNLRNLQLTDNLINDVSPISKLKNLKELTISLNPIKNIYLLSKCFSLESLSFFGVDVVKIDFLNSLNKLSEIGASDNSIQDVSVFIKLNEQTRLWLNNNSIKYLPKEFSRKYNWLNNSLLDFGEVDSLRLSHNPLEFPPSSIIELGPENVKNYYEDAEQYGHEALSEGRIIFIGDGGSGKSSIIEKILYNTFTLGRPQTNGINIENLYLQHPEDDRQLTFHIWDFGGQEIQHAVHKFFFTEGCVYVLVLDNRKEEEPEYWLQQIESLGGKAPVLVVFNKYDENAAETVDRKFLKEKYPNIIGFFNTSCSIGIGIEDFKKILHEQAVKLRTVAERFPNNWLKIKTAIEQYTSGTQHYLNYDSYKEICRQNHVTSEEAQKLLLRYFNTIGSVTWFGDDTYLQFLHVLNPAWITQGVYKILTAKKTAYLSGQIEVKDFKELLQPLMKGDYTYDEGHYGYILAMMKKFALCYTPDDNHLLIPSAFGKQPKVEYSDFRGEKVRIYILQYKDYMPLALIHRFTAQKLSQAFENNYWYTGIVIKDSKSNSLAMVHADKEAKRMYVRIKGEAQLAMWEYIRRDLAEIAATYARIPYDELVALDSGNESTVKYEDLIGHLKAQKQFYFHPRLQKDYNVGYLMGLFETKEQTLEKLDKGELLYNERDKAIKEQIPPVIFQILNNNSPVVNSNITAIVNIDLQIVNKIGSTIKGEADYLLKALGEANQPLTEALQKIIEFANDAKAAKNTGDIKEKGWHRKLKQVMEVLKTGKDQLKTIQDSGEAVKGILHGIKELAHHFHLGDLTSLFS